MPASSLRIPFDKLWKSITTEHFTDFLAMFLPDLYEQIDFAVKFSFLEQELESVIVNKNLRKADKLVGVHLKNGEEKWVYVHIEFENSANTNIKERMYNYHTCIKEKYGQEITAIVLYTGRKIPQQYNYYFKEVFGTSITYRFNTYAIIQQDEAVLKSNPNPFAIVVLANLYVLQTYHNYPKRLELKEHIYRLARERGYPDEKTHRLIIFLSELIQLPEDLEEQYRTYITHPQKVDNKMYLTKKSLAIADAILEAEYGKTYTQINDTITQTIKNFYLKSKLSPEEIADFMGLEVAEVLKILRQQKLTKRRK
ncbi:MAG TPA: Rpn family recombination-promoting nuclease/putative transposase [Chitinophagales bacterium]|nr:Rpn family recombination-promoting nuclease/putative transposase [Chitinophagales bacterium]